MARKVDKDMERKMNENMADASKKYIDLSDAEITNIRHGKYGTTFTIKKPGLQLFNMRLATNNSGGYFLAPPSVKGKNGEYYNQYAVYIEEKDSDRIIDMLVEDWHKNC